MNLVCTVVEAPAKLTLSLRVTGVRDDGLHLIDAEMVTLDLCDTLEITEGGEGLELIGASEDVPVGPQNLVNKALKLCQRQASVRVTKRIPSQAGLGGGSSDAAAVLRWASWTNLSQAADLGADVAFCLLGGRARVSGIGEVVSPLKFKPVVVTLLTPPLSCSTAQVYKTWDALGGPSSVESDNDLESAALAFCPELAEFKHRLESETGERANLAGSGSTWFVYGEFPGADRVVARAVPAKRS